MQVQESNSDILEYWDILVRRKMAFITPFAIVMAAIVALAFLLPPTYRSEATILVQRQAIPQNIVATTVTGYAQEQIQQILQRITTFDNLIEIAEQFGLYGQELVDRPEDVAESVRDAIEVEMLDVEASSPDQAGTRVATIAFTVSFAANTAEKAQAITEDLSHRFIKVHTTVRSQLAADVTSFLGDEQANLQDEITRLEARLAEFKRDEFNQLPELMGSNLQLYERTEQQIQDAEERVRNLERQLQNVRAELSVTDPYQEVLSEDGRRILSSRQRLEVLTSDYLVASARYSSVHPDVIRLRREIQSLVDESDSSGRIDEMMSRHITLQEELRNARGKYGDSHPEVSSLEKQLASLQRALKDGLLSNAETETLVVKPNNPVYVSLVAEQESLISNLTAERNRLEDLNDRLIQYEQRLALTPATEKRYRALNREYEEALERYEQISSKQLQARMAETLEAGESGEQWLLVSNAYLPTFPESPNRIGILLLGLLLAAGAGIVMVAVKEYQDNTIRDAKQLYRLLGVPPLAQIPEF